MLVKGRKRLVELPSHAQTLLLRACLLNGSAGRRAWVEWREKTQDPIGSIRRDDCGLRRILPLLFLAAKNHRIEIGGLLVTILRTAYVREHLRMKIYSKILDQVLGAFAAEQIDAVILNGAALAHSVYAQPRTRHCHDIDILTTEDGIAKAQRVLPTIGFSQVIQDAHSARFEHGSNLPVELHTRLRYQRNVTSPFATIAAEGRDQTIGGHSVRVLGPVNSLLQIVSHPAAQERGLPLGAFCDATFVIQRTPSLDWTGLVDRARQQGLAEHIAPAFECMRDFLDAPVPGWVFDGPFQPRSGDEGPYRVSSSSD